MESTGNNITLPTNTIPNVFTLGMTWEFYKICININKGSQLGIAIGLQKGGMMFNIKILIPQERPIENS